jgi:outer membrane lipoprotein-sorting protein
MRLFTFLVINLALLYPGAVYAEELTGRDIAVKMDAVDNSLDNKRAAVMVVQRQEQKLVRRMEIYGKRFGPDRRSLIKFIDPPDARDIMYLTWSHQDFAREDDMWVFLPAENLVRRISGGGKKGAFMRSDLANEDIQRREVDDDTHQLVRSETFADTDCYVVEFVSKKQDETNYAKRVTWVRKDLWLPVKTEYYNKQGRHFKTATYGGFEQIANIWTATKFMVETPNEGSKTLMQYETVTYNTGLADTLFEQTALQR